MEYMSQFGRPLFWTMLRGARNNRYPFLRSNLELARAKLILSHQIYDPPETFMAKLAVLAAQLSLEFDHPRCTEKEKCMEAELVDGHMRIIHSIPQHMLYMRSGYPSEPLIAEAAAQQLWTWNELSLETWRPVNQPFSVVTTLTEVVKAVSFVREEIEGLTGRQLLLDAYHRAVLEETTSRFIKFSAGCRLTNFIRALFTDECASLVLGSTPDNMKGASFEETFKDAIICFTHFSRVGNSVGLTSIATWAAFLRHSALMAPRGEQDVECILPVLLRDTKLCEHVMTSVVIRFKRQAPDEYSIDQDEFNFFPETPKPETSKRCGCDTLPDNRPYVSLIMELGVQGKTPSETTTATEAATSTESATTTETAPTVEAATTTDTAILADSQQDHPAEGHPRYNIFAYGCTPAVYRGVNDDNQEEYDLLLDNDQEYSRAADGGGSYKELALSLEEPYCFTWVTKVEVDVWADAVPNREFFVGNRV